MIENIHRLFLNELIEFPNGSHLMHQDTDIVKIDYNLNSLGYRSREFDGKSEMLFLGCSNTYGQGIPEEDAWTSILSKKVNLSSSSLAARGDSIIGQVTKAFYYFQKFGNPKIIVALFPFARIMTPYAKGKMETKNKFKRRKFEEYEYMPMVEYSETWGTLAPYAKSPYDPQDILSEEFVFFYENIFIDMLRQYCKSNGIRLVWSNWDPMYQQDIYKNVNLFYPNHYEEYCYMDVFDWKIPGSKVVYGREDSDDYVEHNALDCHSDYDRSHILFYRAADRDNGHIPHWGTHKHLHIAENFYEYIVKKGWNFDHDAD